MRDFVARRWSRRSQTRCGAWRERISKRFASFVHLRAAVATTRESLWQLVDAIVCRGRDLLGYLLTWGLRWIVGAFTLMTPCGYLQGLWQYRGTGAEGATRGTLLQGYRATLSSTADSSGIRRHRPLLLLPFRAPFPPVVGPCFFRSFVAVLLFRWLLAGQLHGAHITE